MILFQCDKKRLVGFFHHYVRYGLMVICAALMVGGECNSDVAVNTPLQDNIVVATMDVVNASPENNTLPIASAGSAQIVKEPNNILALEYLKRMVKTNSTITPITIPRNGLPHNSEEPSCDYASATALRKKFFQQGSLEGFIDYLPIGSYKNFLRSESRCNIQMEDLFTVVVSEILRTPPEELAKIFSVTEGLENKLKSEVRNSNNMCELIDKINSKRYVKTKIQRMLMHILVHLDQESLNQIIAKRIIYGRILAMNDNGAKLLRTIKKTKSAKIPIITNINKDVRDDSLLWTSLNYDVLATDLYNLSSGNSLYAGADYIVKPVKI